MKFKNSANTSVTWHHCLGSQNPADITTRGATVVGLHDTFWQNGPRWLIQRESWPLERSSYTEESKKELTVQPVIATPEKEKWWTRFSKWTTVVGVVRAMLSWKYRSLMKFEINRKAEHILFPIVLPSSAFSWQSQEQFYAVHVVTCQTRKRFCWHGDAGVRSCQFCGTCCSNVDH